MLRVLHAFLGALGGLMRSRTHLMLENLALRQQLAVFKANQPRPKLARADRGFWMLLSRWWAGWDRAIIVVQPDTVVRWHRAGFKLFWRWKSKRRGGGRPLIDGEIKKLIAWMASDNATWGSPRIHSEFKKLGFVVSPSTVARYMPKRPTPPEAIKRWMAFLKNHADGIAAMDFFTVPTAMYGVLYVWFAILHARREIAHFAVTDRPHGRWVVQQLREAFPYDSAPKYLIFDGDGTFKGEVERAVEGFGTKAKRTAPRSPWQNGVAERWIGSCRREMLDHVVVFNEAHLTQLLKSYVAYYMHDRLHLCLAKDAPVQRPVTPRPSNDAKVVAMRRVGGLHHRYAWRKAA